MCVVSMTAESLRATQGLLSFLATLTVQYKVEVDQWFYHMEKPLNVGKALIWR